MFYTELNRRLDALDIALGNVPNVEFNAQLAARHNAAIKRADELARIERLKNTPSVNLDSGFNFNYGW